MERTLDSATPVHVVVKEAIATLEECHPTKLGSLDRAIDSEQLDAVTTLPAAEFPVQFRYCGYTVTIDDTETIRIER